MNDRDETSGQFVENNLVGERAAEAAAGYIPHAEEPEAVGPADAKELGESLAELRGHDAEPEQPLGLTDPDDDSPKQAYSQQQLVEHLAEERRTHDSVIEMVSNSEVAAYADSLRAYLNGADNGAADQPPQKAEAANPQAPVVEAAPSPEVLAMIETGVERDVAEALAKPQVRAAVEAELAKAESVKGEYAQALQAGQQMLQATVAALAPQLDGMPLELWPQAIQTLAQVDPARANLVADTLQKWGAIQQAQQQAQQQQAYIAHQQFEATAKAEDARLDQLLPLFKANPILSTAEARQLVWKATQYDRIQQAKVTAAAKPAPQVQRPGVPASAAERSASTLNDRTSRARDRINSGRGDAKDLGSLIGALRRA
jgi:hypothetical protein